MRRRVAIGMVLAAVLAVAACARENESAPDAAEKDAGDLIVRARTLARGAAEKQDPAPFDDAEKLLKEAIRRRPESAEPYAELAGQYLARADFWAEGDSHEKLLANARAMMEKAVERDPASRPRRLEIARIATQLGDHAGAEAILRRLADEDPNDRMLLVEQGINFYNLEKYGDAQKMLRRYMDEFAHDSEGSDLIRATEYLGRAYMKEGKLAEAEEVLKISAHEMDVFLERTGNDGYWGCPYQALGELYSKTGRADKETEYLARAADAEAFRVWMQVSAAVRSYDVGDYDGALRFFERAMALEPEDKKLRVARAVVLLGLKRYDDAEAVLNAMRREEETHGVLSVFHPPLSAIGLGHLALVRKDFREAEARLDKFLATPSAYALRLFARPGKVNDDGETHDSVRWFL
ncbi:MAG: tetratricopeptide repeat protein [Deltaproteobacteria bacterium]|nr:tetratricopeptide repeat protein [Deltaproteobacteria bacterium]